MKIRLNGKETVVEDGTTMEELLFGLSISKKGMAVELNKQILPRTRYAETVLEEGDSVEVVRMVGGG